MFVWIILGLLVLAITFSILWLMGRINTRKLKEEQDTLEKEKDDLIDDDATKLKESSDDHAAKLEEKQKELVLTLEKENSKLQDELEGYKVYQVKYERLSKRMASGDPQAVTPSNDNIKREHDQERTRLEQELGQLKSSLYDKNRELDEKNRQLEESSGEAEQVRAELEKESAEHQQVSGKVATLNESLQAKENELTGLQETMRQKDQELTAVRDRLTAAADRLTAVKGKPVIPTQALPACFLDSGPLCDWGEKIFRETEVNPDKLVIRELFSLILSLKVAADSGNQDNLLGCLREVSKPMYRLLKEEGMDENESYQVAKLWADSLNDDIGKQFNVGIKVPQHGEPLSRRWMNITSGKGQSVAGILSWAIIRDDVAVRKADITT